MKFTRLYAEDLFSYAVLDLPLADRGLLLVEGENRDLGGSNGAGKSSIFKILRWALFGKLPGLKADAVIREDANHNQVLGKSRAVVDIEIGDQRVQVFRHRRHASNGNKIILVIDGVDVSRGTDAETQRVLDSLLGMDDEVFSSAVLFPQGQIGFASLSDANQKGILDSILGIGRFDEARERAKALLDDLQKQLLRVEASITVTDRHIVSASSALTQLRTDAQSWQQSHDKYIESLRSDVASITEPEAPPEWVQEQITTLQTWFADNSTQVKSLPDNLRAVNAAVVESSREVGRLEGLLQSALSAPTPTVPTVTRPDESLQAICHQIVEVKANILQNTSEASRSADWIRELKAQIQDRDTTTHCDKCGQSLDASAKSHLWGNLNEQLAAEEQSYASLQADGIDLDRLLGILQQKRSDATAWSDYAAKTGSYVDPEPIREALESARAKHRGLLEQQSGLIAYQDGVRTAQSRLQQCEQTIEAYRAARCARAEKRLDLQKRIETAIQETNPHEHQIEQQTARIDELNRAAKFHRTVRDRLSEDRDAAAFWVDGFGNRGVKSLIYDHSTQHLEDSANAYLDMLSAGTAQLSISPVQTLASGDTRDVLDVSVKFQNGGGTYDSLSGGERRRVDLSLLFALGDVGASRSRSPIQLRLLDEPFDDLCSVGSEQVVDLLRTYIVPSAGTVLVMSHNDHLKTLIEDRIVVVKQHGVSTIEQ